MTSCESVDRVTGLHCVKAEGHQGLCSAPTANQETWQHWGTVTIPSDVLERWLREAEAERG